VEEEIFWVTVESERGLCVENIASRGDRDKVERE
jgi:hypothetical protein